MDDLGKHSGLEGRPFAVADSVHCCWDPDHAARTLEFLEGIDSNYFSTVAALLAQQLESEDSIATSVALRVLYHQGVETLMSLLGAAAHGPYVVPAWIAKCSTENLKTVVTRLQSGQPLLTEVGTQRVTFDLLSSHLHRFAWVDEKGADSTAARFGRFWHRLASELLDDTARAEYNALKHGSRVLPGGFSMAIRTEEALGVPVPPEQMHSIGGSKFGSTFFVTEPVGTAKWHVRTRQTSVNWLPEPLAQRLARSRSRSRTSSERFDATSVPTPQRSPSFGPRPQTASTTSGGDSPASPAPTWTTRSGSNLLMSCRAKTSAPSSRRATRMGRRQMLPDVHR